MKNDPKINETRFKEGSIFTMWIFRPWWEDIYMLNNDGMCNFPYVLEGS